VGCVTIQSVTLEAWVHLFTSGTDFVFPLSGIIPSLQFSSVPPGKYQNGTPKIMTTSTFFQIYYSVPFGVTYQWFKIMIAFLNKL
jgi:hypothetical protein